MPCDHQLLNSHLPALLDESLSQALRQRCETALLECEHCRGLYEQALHYSELAQKWQDEEVPAWNRARHLVQPQRKTVPAWLHWSALAASVMAMALTLSRAEIDTRDGFVLRFGGQNDADLRRLATVTLAEASATQSAVLDARLQQFALDQQQANRLLYTSWDEAGRRERQQEIGMLLSGWQNQRIHDQQTINTRFNELTNDQIENTQYLNTFMKTVAAPGRRAL